METAFFSPASLFRGDDGRDEMQVDAEGEKQALRVCGESPQVPWHGDYLDSWIITAQIVENTCHCYLTFPVMRSRRN